jgi:competence protein ComFB
MELHNTIEDIVIPKVEEIYDAMEKDGNPDKICTCPQCRIDAACYALNRASPYYVVSNRGVARVHMENIERQQLTADVAALIHEGIQKVHHNQRFNYEHTPSSKTNNAFKDKPAFIIPAITGRLFDGGNFSPVTGASIHLLFSGAPAVMQEGHWQNPIRLESYTEGTFSFWPVPVPAKKIGEKAAFQYTIQAEAEGYEPLNHVFRIPLVSELLTHLSFTLEKSYKLPDLFIFPQGGETEKDRYLVGD